MGKLSFARLAAAVGGVGLALTAGAGIASADPEAAINTTCNEGQVMSALQVVDPGAAAQLSASPMGMNYLRQFLAAPPPQRREMAAQLAAMPAFSRYINDVDLVAQRCGR